MDRTLQLHRHHHLATIEFRAMASSCQVLLDTDDWTLAAKIAELVAQECWRIEEKYSRYRADSVVGVIHQQTNQWVAVDEETARLFDFADTLYVLSDGLFDISSGILRRVWRFDGSDRVPSQQDIQALQAHIGWHLVKWDRVQQQIFLPDHMEIDLGGIGKEYAVDCCADVIERHFSGAFLVNFGGDLRARGPRQSGSAWQIGLESPHHEHNTAGHFTLSTGALATSGDAKRYVFKDGMRYGHILNPKTGWPIQGAPRSITILAKTCVEAGMLATLAMLQGEDARSFLKDQMESHAWIVD